MNQEEHTKLVHDLMEAYADRHYAIEHNNKSLERVSTQAIGDIIRQLFVLNDVGGTPPAVVHVDVDVFSIPI